MYRLILAFAGHIVGFVVRWSIYIKPLYRRAAAAVVHLFQHEKKKKKKKEKQKKSTCFLQDII